MKVYTVYYDDRKCFPNLIKKFEIKYLYKAKDEIMKYKIIEVLIKRFFRPWQELLNEKIFYELLKMMDPDTEILNCHDYGIYPLGAKFKERYKKPTVYTMNGLPIYKFKARSFKEIIKLLLSPLRGNLFLNQKHKDYLSSYDKIVVLDNYNREKLKDNLGFDSIVIRSGLDISNFKYVPRTKPNKIIRIFANGIFLPHRRFEDLITALYLLDRKSINFELRHVGADKKNPLYAKKIYKLINNYKLNRKVKFYGYVSDENLIHLYQASDIFVFPNYPQTWGLAVFEAMSCGTPVIVSTGCGASEVLSDGENALLVLPKSPQKIVDAIIRMKETPSLWKRLSINGRKFVEENIRWDLYTQNMEKVFNDELIRDGI